MTDTFNHLVDFKNNNSVRQCFVNSQAICGANVPFVLTILKFKSLNTLQVFCYSLYPTSLPFGIYQAFMSGLHKQLHKPVPSVGHLLFAGSLGWVNCLITELKYVNTQTSVMCTSEALLLYNLFYVAVHI